MTQESGKKQSEATEQASKVSPISGVAPPKERQFGQPNGNPRNPGGWKKEDTARYKLEQMMKLGYADLKEIAQDENAPLFERRIAKSLLKEDSWKTTEAMINQVYGMPKEQKDITSNGEVITGLEIGFKSYTKDESKNAKES